jgi:PQQ-like domain
VVAPERRTRGDLVAVAVIAVAVLTAVTLLWRFSDARATVSQPAGGEPAALVAPAALPPSLAQAWEAPSGATPAPVLTGSTVVTADGREVVGRDPFTGEPRWRYVRDIDLCTASAAWNNALTVWSKDPRFCSEVTALSGDNGTRADQRNGDAERGTRVLFDGTHATAIGHRYLETWRSDLVRTTQYGAVPTPVNPGKQPRSGCTYVSAAVAANQIALIERCPSDGGETGDRLTVLKANPKEAEQPEVIFSVPLGVPAALVVAVSGQRTAVLMPDPNRLAVYDAEGRQVGSYWVDVPLPAAGMNASNGSGAPAVADTMITADTTYWFTGSSTVALDHDELRPQWTVDGTLGSGAIFAGRLLVPAQDQLVVLDAASGARLGATPVDRSGYAGPVRLATAGSVVLEQRGAQLVALR